MHWRIRVCFIGLSLTLGACVSARSKDLTEQFGTSAAALTKTLPDTLIKVRRVELEHGQALALSDSTVGFNTATTPQITLDSVVVRVAVAQELEKYATNLSILMSDAEQERISKASAELYSSLSNLNETANTKAPAESLQAIATATNAIGTAYFERARFNEVKTIVANADGIVGTAVDETNADLNLWKASQQRALKNTATTLFGISQMGDGFKTVTDGGVRRNIPRIEGISQRELLLKRAAEYGDSAAATPEEFAKVTKALDALKKAHAALKVALENDDDLDFDNAKAQVSTLSGDINDLRAFYKALGKKPEQKQE